MTSLFTLRAIYYWNWFKKFKKTHEPGCTDTDQHYYLSKLFMTIIVYKLGKTNTVADVLLRWESPLLRTYSY